MTHGVGQRAPVRATATPVPAATAARAVRASREARRPRAAPRWRRPADDRTAHDRRPTPTLARRYRRRRAATHSGRRSRWGRRRSTRAGLQTPRTPSPRTRRSFRQAGRRPGHGSLCAAGGRRARRPRREWGDHCAIASGSVRERERRRRRPRNGGVGLSGVRICLKDAARRRFLSATRGEGLAHRAGGGRGARDGRGAARGRRELHMGGRVGCQAGVSRVGSRRASRGGRSPHAAPVQRSPAVQFPPLAGGRRCRFGFRISVTPGSVM